MRSYSGKVFCWREHWKRLLESAHALGQIFVFSEGDARKWIARLIQESGFRDSVLRFSVHWEPSASLGVSGAIVLMFREFKAYPEEIYRKGVTLRTGVPRRWNLKAQDSRIKVSQYTNGVLAVLDHLGTKARELIFLNQDGYVAEGSVSNLFIVNGKRILTPCVGSGILKGVTHDVVIGLARRRGWQVTETFLTRHEIYTAEECFMTNTSSEVLPVVEVDGRSIGNGKPGPVAKILRSDFKKAVGR